MASGAPDDAGRSAGVFGPGGKVLADVAIPGAVPIFLSRSIVMGDRRFLNAYEGQKSGRSCGLAAVLDELWQVRDTGMVWDTASLSPRSSLKVTPSLAHVLARVPHPSAVRLNPASTRHADRRRLLLPIGV